MGDTRDYPNLLSRVNDALLKKHDEHSAKAMFHGDVEMSKTHWAIAGAYLEASKILCAMWMMPETKDKE